MTSTDAPVLPPVRLAGPDDAESLFGLCRMLHDENGVFDLDEEMIKELIYSAVFNQPTPSFPFPPRIGVIGTPDHLEGSICLRLGRMWYAKQHVLEEFWSFVHPDHRKSRHAVALIEFAKDCQHRVGIPLLIGVISNTRTEEKVKLYERRLGKKVGAFFLYNGNGTGSI